MGAAALPPAPRSHAAPETAATVHHMWNSKSKHQLPPPVGLEAPHQQLCVPADDVRRPATTRLHNVMPRAAPGTTDRHNLQGKCCTCCCASRRSMQSVQGVFRLRRHVVQSQAREETAKLAWVWGTRCRLRVQLCINHQQPGTLHAQMHHIEPVTAGSHAVSPGASGDARPEKTAAGGDGATSIMCMRVCVDDPHQELKATRVSGQEAHVQVLQRSQCIVGCWVRRLGALQPALHIITTVAQQQADVHFLRPSAATGFTEVRADPRLAAGRGAEALKRR